MRGGIGGSADRWGVRNLRGGGFDRFLEGLERDVAGVQQSLELSRGFEDGLHAAFYLHELSSPGIACGASSAGPDLEATESADLDVLPISESAGYGIQQAFEDRLGFGLGHARAAGDFLDDVLFGDIGHRCSHSITNQTRDVQALVQGPLAWESYAGSCRRTWAIEVALVSSSHRQSERTIDFQKPMLIGETEDVRSRWKTRSRIQGQSRQGR